jgi:hypothetical protein
MKKLKLSIAMLTIAISGFSQNAIHVPDTACVYFTGKEVYHFDYQQDTILSKDEQTSKFYEINLTYGQTLCLDLSDEKPRLRKVITEFFDGSTTTQVLESENNVYFSPIGVVKVLVSKPRIIFLGTK